VSQGGLLQLDDAEFWSAPFRTRDETQRRLSREGFLGVAIDAPQRVPLDGRQTIPVVGWDVATFRQAKKLRFEDFALVTAVSQDDGYVYTGRLYDPRVKDSRQAAPEDEDPGEGKSYRAFTFDLNERVGIGLRPKACVVTMIVQDQVSNRVTTTLCPPQLSWVDPEVKAFLAERRGAGSEVAERFPQAVSPPASGALPSYEASAKTPEIPTSEGLALVGPQKATRNAPCPVYGSFRVPVPEDLRVRERPDQPGWGVGDDKAVAVIPVTLVVTGGRVPGPYVARLQVPIYEAVGEDSLGVGHFALDLCQVLGGLGAQNYFVYAFSGSAFFGPVSIELS
jgi:hypothetical protein